jgi:DNA-binding CsgD family transcriptional regulator
MSPRTPRQLSGGALTRLADEVPDLRAFRSAVLERLRPAIGFDWYVWVLTDPRTTVGVDPLAEVPDLSELPRMIRLKYLTALNRWPGLETVAVLGDRAGESALWAGIQRRHGVADVASVSFRDRFGCWGFLDLWSSRPYAAADVALLRDLAPMVTLALRQGQARTFGVVPSVEAPAGGPVVILLDDDLRVTGLTAASEEWLRVLLPGPDGAPPVPAGAYNVAAQLLAREQGVDDHEAMARAHLSGGFWVTLRASRIVPDGAIAVTMEPAAADDRLDVFARATGLSDRERELLTHLAHGADTREAAGLLCVSPHTVQDHLKSIFAKTATGSRRVLLSHVLGTRTADGTEGHP